jgi:hypothetical protein
MQGEFEKQVQQKMDSLRLVPSEPVWEQVHDAIKKRNDRRRFLFFFLLALLTGAVGLWYFTATNRDATPQHSSVISQKNSPATEKNTTKIIPPATMLPVTTPGGSFKKSSEKLSARFAITITKKQRVMKQAGTKELTSPGGNPVQQSIELKSTPGLTINAAEDKKAINRLLPDTRIDSNTTIVSKDSLMEMPGKQPLSEPAANKASPVKKIASRKWHNILYLQVGVSSYLQGSSLKSNFYSSPATAGSNYGSSTPSNTSPGFSWVAGAGVIKDIGRRIQLTLALQLHYYSTHITVGADSSVLANSLLSLRYYANTPGQDYVNKISIAELPVSIDFQLLKQSPLRWSAGLAYGRLLHSNALTYSPVSNLYSTDKNNNKKDFIQLQSSLQYALGPKQQISIGPLFQYSFTKLQRYGYYASSHLSFIGVQTGIKFK